MKWFLNKAIHGDKVTLDSMVMWRSVDPGQADVIYPAGAFEECFHLAFMVFVSAVRAAVSTLGWESSFWESALITHLAPVGQEIEEIMTSEAD